MRTTIKDRFGASPGQESSSEWGVIYQRIIDAELIDQDNEHMGYLSFLRVFEEAQRVLQRERGLTHQHILEKFGVRLFVGKLEIEYMGKVKVGEDIRVFSKMIRRDGSNVYYDQVMFGCDDAPIATAIFEIVCVG